MITQEVYLLFTFSCYTKCHKEKGWIIVSKKLVIISVDALGAQDVSGNEPALPTFNQIKSKGTHIKNIAPIYPSLTYPSHTTIMTGVYPRTHGVVNNTKLQSQRVSPDWFWYQKDIKVPTVYDVAGRAGLTTAAFLWPVTAKSKITYNIAEIFPNRIWTNQVLVSLKASSPFFLFEMNRKYGYLRQGIAQPFLDDFITACTIDTLVTKQPELTLIHLVDLDSQRHAHGVNSPEANAALQRQDKRVSDIIEATKQAGTYADTVFAILGDHFQIDVTHVIRLNYEFASRGWQQATKEGTTEEKWDVYAKSCDGSTYIYCREESLISPREIKDVVLGIEGIEAIYTSQEAVAQGAAPNCTFMLEAKRGYYFADEAEGPTIKPVLAEEIGQVNRYRAVHGFSPKKENYQTTMIVFGPGIKAGHTIQQARLIDEAPTFAAILNLKDFPKNIDGTVIDDLFV